MTGSDNSTLLLSWASMVGKICIDSNTIEFNIRQGTIKYWWTVMNTKEYKIKCLYIPTYMGKNKLIINK